MRRVFRHPRALTDVAEIVDFLAAAGGRAAPRFIDALEPTLRALAEHPELGVARSFQRKSLEGVRSFPVFGFGDFLIFYRRRSGAIEVLRIVHGARDLERLLDDRVREATEGGRRPFTAPLG